MQRLLQTRTLEGVVPGRLVTVMPVSPSHGCCCWGLRHWLTC